MAEEPKKSIRDRLRGVSSQDTAPQPLPELAARSMIVSIFDIAEYKGNPRIYPNPEHESIKESIRSRGLLQQLVVTQEPGSSKYVLMQGGNTRLKCLRELYEETSDSKFAQIVCEYRPWTTEDDLLIGHYIENEQRGNLNWYEKSALVCRLHSMFEARSGELPLTSRDFERQATTAGIRIRRSELNLNRYTVDRLADRLPQLYQRGVGKRTIEKIRRLDLAAASIWQDAGLDSTAFNETFFSFLSDYDSSGDFSGLISNTTDALGDHLHDINFHKMQFLLRRHVLDNDQAPKFEDLYQAPLRGVQANNGPIITVEETTAPSSSDFTTEKGAPSGVKPGASRPGRLGRLRSFQNKSITARKNIFRAAENFAGQTGNHGCLESRLFFGYGFLVFHLPENIPDLTKEFQAHRDQAWWLLVELSDLTTATLYEPERLAKVASAINSNIQPCFEHPDPQICLQQLARDHGMTMPGYLSNLTPLLTHMSDHALKNFNLMIKHYRALEQIAQEFDIWRYESKYE